MSKIITTEIFIERARKIHGDLYGYDGVIYKSAKTKINIFCRKHFAIFEQTSDNHLNGSGCRRCGIERTHNKQRLGINTFIEKARKIHGEKYNYDAVIYVDAKTNVTIYCNKHTINFQQSPTSHFSGNGCPQCARKKRANKLRQGINTFIEKARKIHGEKYSYDAVIYKGVKTNVTIFCRKHSAIFEQTPDNHLQGKGCPQCRYEGLAGYYSNIAALRGDYKGKLINIYFIKLHSKDNSETFYKIGLTINMVNYRNPGSGIYSYQVIKIINKTNMTKAILFEHYIHNEYPDFVKISYKPKKEFSGDNECYHSLEKWDLEKSYTEFCNLT